ncbi:MAG: 7-cyano-7-deazaguanine synthase, partial [Desulfobacteraceae bacterium]
DSDLIGSKTSIFKSHRSSNKLPSSFVPGRNLLFLTIGATFAYKMNIFDIVTGVCEVDYSGYPDCRENTIKATESALSLGMDCRFTIHTPLMFLTKSETVKLSMHLEGCFEALSYSHTCYNGIIPPCGKCPSCELRAAGFKEAGVADPLLERVALIPSF